MSEELKRKLQEVRGKLGIGQEGMAIKLGVSRRTLEKWEQNKATPRGFALAALNRALDQILNSK